jgi:hypothetical protein
MYEIFKRLQDLQDIKKPKVVFVTGPDGKSKNNNAQSIYLFKSPSFFFVSQKRSNTVMAMLLDGQITYSVTENT